ncbi:hypothetical protein K3169_14420 [Pseudomonas phytophila]|uniref:Uncharacterized protein n=1 Tax=Pseudomonas phytophila TaxID=2867264 RepID=A0ABY6FM57_9PSED|nr:hypothetical protein [Pseudomonas phytophila]UXZ98975.1 hypothetical protein K3169_14420 [Pseudomonas phytophila]
MSDQYLPHHLWVGAIHYVAAKIVLSAPEFSEADRDKASIVVEYTGSKLSSAGFAPNAESWLSPQSLEVENVGGPVYRIPMADGDQVIHVPSESYRKAIQVAYSCPLISDPSKTIT